MGQTNCYIKIRPLLLILSFFLVIIISVPTFAEDSKRIPKKEDKSKKSDILHDNLVIERERDGLKDLVFEFKRETTITVKVNLMPIVKEDILIKDNYKQ